MKKDWQERLRGVKKRRDENKDRGKDATHGKRTELIEPEWSKIQRTILLNVY